MGGEFFLIPRMADFIPARTPTRRWTTMAIIFTWTQQEVRAVLTPDEARVAETLLTTSARAAEMHHNPGENVLWIGESIEATDGKT